MNNRSFTKQKKTTASKNYYFLTIILMLYMKTTQSINISVNQKVKIKWNFLLLSAANNLWWKQNNLKKKKRELPWTGELNDEVKCDELLLLQCVIPLAEQLGEEIL